ncbi:MAG: TetR/AcrR family transcriptional regulator [Herbiconiux sp.]|nr:TetR/AcrR family transcriptional regulator [Herbiconiux sp.]
MATNHDRRAALADAGIAVLAREGGRGLTHRAVDARSGSPVGTASNYFRDRAALLGALVDRIGERLAPDPLVLEELARLPRGRAAYAEYVRYIVARLTADPDVALALFELRLEAARRPEVGAVITAWQRQSFAADIAFNKAAGLPGGPREIALFHYALDGLLLDRLTNPIDPATPTDAVIDQLVTAVFAAETGPPTR